MGDEIGLDNERDVDPHADGRWLHRSPFPWDRAQLRHDPSAIEGRVYGQVRALIAARAALPALRASVEAVPLSTPSPSVFALLRPGAPRVCVVANFSPDPQPAPDPFPRSGERWDAITAAPVGDELAAYGVWWLVERL